MLTSYNPSKGKAIKICEIRRFVREFEVVHFSEHFLEQGSRLTHEELVATALQGTALAMPQYH
jgi:hypothetical protein